MILDSDSITQFAFIIFVIKIGPVSPRRSGQVRQHHSQSWSKQICIRTTLHLVFSGKQARVMNTMFEQFLDASDFKVRIQMLEREWIRIRLFRLLGGSFREHFLSQFIIDL